MQTWILIWNSTSVSHDGSVDNAARFEITAESRTQLREGFDAHLFGGFFPRASMPDNIIHIGREGRVVNEFTFAMFEEENV
tara:strand:+ start:182 stop:424 length:243 start_codon:yes stop_codon:yes gene_type:complete